jgi:hypothetical protein
MSETTVSKLAAKELQNIIQIANGMTLVLLTATPMYDTYDEIIYYFITPHICLSQFLKID